MTTSVSEPLGIIIPAAGYSPRMRTYSDLPKSLIQLTDRMTLLDHQLRVIRERYPSARVAVVVGHGADEVMRRLPRDIVAIENENYRTTGTLRSIGMALHAINTRRILIIYGDLAFQVSAIEGPLCGPHSAVLVNKTDAVNGVGAMVVDGCVTRFSYDIYPRWCQIAYLTGFELAVFRQVAQDRAHSRWLGFEGLNAVLEKGGRLLAIGSNRDLVAEIDAPGDLSFAQRIVGGRK